MRFASSSCDRRRRRRCLLLFRLFAPLALLVGALTLVDSAKILVTSSNLSNSLIIVGGHIADVLIEAGHNVVRQIEQLQASNFLRNLFYRLFSSMKCDWAFASSTVHVLRPSFVCARSPIAGTSKCLSTPIRSSNLRPRGGADATNIWLGRRRAKVRLAASVVPHDFWPKTIMRFLFSVFIFSALLERFDELRSLRDEKFDLAVCLISFGGQNEMSNFYAKRIFRSSMGPIFAIRVLFAHCKFQILFG